MGFLLSSSFWELLLVLLCTLVLYGYLWIRKRYRYFADRAVFYLEPSFPFGNTYKMFKGEESMGETIERMYRRGHGNRVMGAYQGLSPVLILRDPLLVQQVFIRDFSSFQDRGIVVDDRVNPLEGHLFRLSGSKWRILRTKLSPTFTSGKLKEMHPLVASSADGFLEYLGGLASDGDVEIMEALARFTTETIGSCAFGLETSAFQDPDCQFRRMGNKFFRPSLWLATCQLLRDNCPRLFLPLGVRTTPKEVNDFFFSVVKQAFEHRLKTGAKRNDFVELLLQLREKGSIEYDPEDREVDTLLPEDDSSSLKLTDEVLTAQAFVFFFAGFETSSTSMSFTLYLLAKHPELQDRARREIRAVKAEHGGITYDAVRDMVYLEACFNEAVRMFPPVQHLARQCVRSCVLEGGTTVESGTKVFVSVQGLQHDPEYFPDPEKYDPDRFGPQGSVVPGTFLPFGDGPRVCIAKRFALLEIKTALAKILDNFEFSRSPKLTEPFRLNPRAINSQPIDGIWLKVKRISAG